MSAWDTKLVCTFDECKGPKDEGKFSVNLVVDCRGMLAEDPSQIESEYFSCVYCSNEPEWVDV